LVVQWLQYWTCEFDSQPGAANTGWVTVFRRANHLLSSPSHPGQLSLLPLVGNEYQSVHWYSVAGK